MYHMAQRWDIIHERSSMSAQPEKLHSFSQAGAPTHSNT